MIGVKGGKCAECKERVTDGNVDMFDFDHKIAVNNHADKTDRWGGGVRDWPPFTDKWFAWAERVDLICQKCHVKKHRQKTQKCLIDYLEFISVQQRLDNHEPGPAMLDQLKMFGEK